MIDTLKSTLTKDVRKSNTKSPFPCVLQKHTLTFCYISPLTLTAVRGVQEEQLGDRLWGAGCQVGAVICW